MGKAINFVKAKDLVIGGIYAGPSAWRNTFIYLGRSSNKDYVWFFIANDEELRKKPNITFIMDNLKIKSFAENSSVVTKQNKTVQKWSVYGIDRIDTTGLTQQIVDEVARIAIDYKKTWGY